MSTSRSEPRGQELYRQWERSMTQWWEQVLASPSVLHAMGRGLGKTTQARAQYEHAVEERLQRLHLPTRGDLVRMTRIATLLEEKLLQQEDTILALRDELRATRREALEARIEAAEARVELREALATLQAGLAARNSAPRARRTRP
jgi:hypothetical protein